MLKQITFIFDAFDGMKSVLDVRLVAPAHEIEGVLSAVSRESSADVVRRVLGTGTGLSHSDPCGEAGAGAASAEECEGEEEGDYHGERASVAGAVAAVIAPGAVEEELHGGFVPDDRLPRCEAPRAQVSEKGVVFLGVSWKLLSLVLSVDSRFELSSVNNHFYGVQLNNHPLLNDNKHTTQLYLAV